MLYPLCPGIWAHCELREQCTRSKDGRTLKRHARQDELDSILAHATSQEGRRNRKTRQHLSERSFARSTRYGYKRARWRRLWRVEIQDFLIAAAQNIMVLIQDSKDRISKSNALRGQILRDQRTIWNGVSLGSVLLRPIVRFTRVITSYIGLSNYHRSLICIASN